MPSHLILIPARSGSTRVPNKNVRELGGKPLLAHAIESAVSAKENLDARVIVSTDSEEIAAVARRFGAETPFLRPRELSGPEATSMSAVLHALDSLADKERWYPELLAFRPPTCPFLTKNSLIEIFRRLDEHRSAQSVNTIFVPEVHPYAIVGRRADGFIEFGAIEIGGRTVRDFERSQDYPDVWAQSAACRLVRTPFFYEILRTQSAPYETRSKLFGELDCLGYEIDRFEAFDVDTEEDLQLAEALLLTRR
jgi:CMP-N-acetylneuraminic acid synthetase